MRDGGVLAPVPIVAMADDPKNGKMVEELYSTMNGIWESTEK